MSTRPKVHQSEVERAITMIARRREKVDDPHRDRLPDSVDADPREVLDYLQRYSGPGIPRWVLQADVADALTLNNHLWWQDRRRELYWLKAGRSRGLFLAQLGSMIGIGKRGVIDRVDRLEALLKHDRPDEKITRAARRAAREADQSRSARDVWLAAHRDELVSIVMGLVAEADRYELEDDGREWVDELERDARDDQLMPATMVILGLAIAELRTAPAVLTLNGPRPHRVHALLAKADALRGQFAELGSVAA